MNKHFNNAVAAYLNQHKCIMQGRRYEANRYDEMAQNFTRWHIQEVGGSDADYPDTYLAVVSEATGYDVECSWNWSCDFEVNSTFKS